MPTEVFASAAWHTGLYAGRTQETSPPGPVGQHRLFPAATSLCEVCFLLQDYPLWSPALGDNQLQTSSNHPTSYGHLLLWSPLPVVSPPGHLYSRFMLTTRRKKPFFLCSPHPHPHPPKLALPSSQAPDLRSHGQPCLAAWMICSESLLCACTSASSTVQGQKHVPFHPVVSKPEQEERQLTARAMSPSFTCALEYV